MRDFKIEANGKTSVELAGDSQSFYLPTSFGFTPGNVLVEMTASEWRELNGPDEPLPVTPVAKHSRPRCEKCGIPLPGGFVGIYGPCCEKPDPVAAKARVLNRFPSAGVRGDATGQWIGDNHGPITTPDRSRTYHEDELWIAADKVTADMPDAAVKQPETTQKWVERKDRELHAGFVASMLPPKQPWEVARDAVLAVWPNAAVGESWHGEIGRGFFIGYGNRVLSDTFIRGEFPDHDAWLDAAARLKTPQKPEWEVSRDAVLAVYPGAYCHTLADDMHTILSGSCGDPLSGMMNTRRAAWIDAAERLSVPQKLEWERARDEVVKVYPKSFWSSLSHIEDGCGREISGWHGMDYQGAWLDAASRLKQSSQVAPNGDYIPVEDARPHVNIGCGVYWFDPLRCMNVFANEPVTKATPVYEIDGDGRITREVR